MNKIKMLLLMIITVLLSVFMSTWVIDKNQKIYSVDLGRITKTQMLIAGRMASSGINKATWMMTIKDTSENIRQTIKKMAGNHIVIVSPAIVQGSIDITDQVLKTLGLPTNLPVTTFSEADVIPSLIPKEAPTGAVVSDDEKPKKSWLLP